MPVGRGRRIRTNTTPSMTSEMRQQVSKIGAICWSFPTSATPSTPGTAPQIGPSSPTGVTGCSPFSTISRRSNAAGLRVGFYAGDAEIVHYLSELRRHAGFMVPGPIQAAGVVALNDDAHVDAQREIYRARLERFVAILADVGIEAHLPGGSFYLWVKVPEVLAASYVPTGDRKPRTEIGL